MGESGDAFDELSIEVWPRNKEEPPSRYSVQSFDEEYWQRLFPVQSIPLLSTTASTTSNNTTTDPRASELRNEKGKGVA
jgi:hypothetical protein